MNIDELLDRYFEGETSSEEEQQLRTFFASGEVPERLSVYTPLFIHLEIEKQNRMDESIPDFILQGIPEPSEVQISRGKDLTIRKPVPFRSAIYLIAGIAACVLMLLGIHQIMNPMDPSFCSGNYVIINGRCYTDIHKVRSMAFEALQEVATPVNEYFPEADEESADRAIVNEQLNELRSLFNDNE